MYRAGTLCANTPMVLSNNSTQSVEQVAAGWKMPAKYAGYSQNAPALFGGMNGMIEGIYQELK